ncbi:phage/plasmid primase, P4 family [Magnetospirillum sp. XM-1]|uniref:phage/plasmid primase, P4 family n=1 Tax=Magnetospirillum sp. XM-1 TaxID=1663591 RepID=UPI0008394244|nr:phage/plasmid primase, P4 family [Magnetospirillum sp. XM-1]
MPVLPLEDEVLGMTAQIPVSIVGGAEPDPAMITAYAELVFGYCDGWVPVRALPEKGTDEAQPSHTPFLEADADLATNLVRQAQWAAHGDMAIYVVPGTVAKHGSAKSDDVVQTQVVLVDLDHGDIASKREHLIHHIGPATMEVASGGVTPEGQRKLHLYWRLTEPAEGDDITTVCRVRHIIATKVGGDPSFRSAHQPIRVAGTIHAKNGCRRLVEILSAGSVERDLGELVEAVLAMPPLDGEGSSWLDFNDAGTARGSVTDLFSQQVREGGMDGTTRFDALSRVMGYWIRRCRDGHISPADAWDEIVAYNEARIDPPWPMDRLQREAERLWVRDQRHGDALDGDDLADEDMEDDDEDAEPVAFTEDALAAAFTQTHAEDWRFVAGWGQWLLWTGCRWERESTLLAYDMARLICRDAASAARSAKLRSKLSSASTVAAVERLARADRSHAATTEVWDRDPWLLNTPGGVVDLHSGQIQPHNRALAMTKITMATPQGDCPIWRQFVATVTGGDKDLQDYLQRVAGYCLTGVTSEHALFFLYGTGANGKSVFANTLTAILGDYATVAAMDMFMATTSERHPTDMAGLRGARIVTSIETEQGRRWAESKLKALTGGDKITARFMRQDFFEFIPQFKLLVAGNHKPAIRNVDEAMRRRLHMVPFTITIPPAKRDKQLSDRLLAERDGILAWAVEGCLAWQRTGLRPPAAVMAATDEYFESEDAFGRWLDERCERGNSFSETTSALFADWKNWTEANGEFTGSIKRFAENLVNRGLEQWRSKTARHFRGVRLCAGTDTSEDMEF